MTDHHQAPATPEEIRRRAAEYIRRVLAASLRRMIEKEFQQLAQRLNYEQR